MIKVTSELWPELVIFCDTPEQAAYIAKELSAEVQSQQRKRRSYWQRKQRESQDRRRHGVAPYEIKGDGWLATRNSIAA